MLTAYNLYMDDGLLSNNFQLVYSNPEPSKFTATGLVAGRLYVIRSTASNAIGESDPSVETSIYASNLPSKPVTPWRGPASTMT